MERSPQTTFIKGTTDPFAPIIQMIEMLASMKHISAAERLTQYVQNIMIIHRQNQFLTQSIHSQLMNPTPCGGEVVNKYISQLSQFIQVILADGIANGEFKSNLNLNDGTVFLVGMIDFCCITKPFPTELAILSEQSEEQYFAQAIPIFLHGIIRRREHE